VPAEIPHILSLVTFLPLIGAGLILLARFAMKGGADSAARWIALGTTLATLAVSVVLVLAFDPANAGYQFVERYEWFAAAQYHLGVDGISILFVLLTAFLMPICIVASWKTINDRVVDYMVAFLVLQTLVIGVFTALDLFLFYIFFEGTLVPMFIIIGVWGGTNRIYAAYKFFLYTLLGSVLMLLAMLWMAWTAGTTSIPELKTFAFSPAAQPLLWLAFFASFAVKMPMWPVHTWLPDAHVQAPTAGSVILAGILLKLGGYGFILFSVPMFPLASQMFAAGVRPVGRRHRLHFAGRLPADRHEEADRLFVGRPHGLRDHGHLRRQYSGHAGRGVPDAEPRPDLGRALPLRRRRL